MAISTYDELLTAVNEFTEREYGSTQLDMFLALWESALNRRLGPDYRRTTTGTLTTDANGEASLPTGFVAMRSIVQDISGSKPLKQVTWSALIDGNPYFFADDPVWFAIQGSTLKVSPIKADTFNLTYDAKLTGLSSSNTSNWLLTAAPDVYFWGVMAQATGYEENWAVAGAQEARAYDLLADLVGQGNVAQFGDVEMQPDTVMP